METTIPCRNCDHPLKSGSCLGCNVFRLYEALVKGKLNWAKDEHNGIVEGKLEQPTLSPDDVRGVGCPVCQCKEPLPEDGMSHEYYIRGKTLYHYDTHFGWEGTDINYCPNCGARMQGDDA